MGKKEKEIPVLIGPNGEEFFVVESIWGKRQRPGKGVEYLVKWKDYPVSANSWEPSSGLTMSKTAIENYKNKIKIKKKRRRIILSNTSSDDEDDETYRQPNSSVAFQHSPIKKQKMKDENDEPLSGKALDRSKEPVDQSSELTQTTQIQTADENVNFVEEEEEEENDRDSSLSDKHSDSDDTTLLNLNDEDDEDWTKTGFDRGLKPSKILAVCEEKKKIFYLMKWEGSSQTDAVGSEEVYAKCPELMIEFYEKHLFLKGSVHAEIIEKAVEALKVSSAPAVVEEESTSESAVSDCEIQIVDEVRGDVSIE